MIRRHETPRGRKKGYIYIYIYIHIYLLLLLLSIYLYIYIYIIYISIYMCIYVYTPFDSTAHFDSTFTELCEIMGDRPTRRGFCDGVISVVSLIDRVFMNLLPSELLSRNAGVCVWDDLNNVDILSDHSPVLFNLGRVAKGGVNKGEVPRWVADRSDFPDIVGEQFERSMTCLVEDPFDRLHR